jgi:hypothetical protein
MDLRKQGVDEKVTVRDGKILVELEGPLGGRALFVGHREIVRTQLNNYSILVPYVKNYFKCFGY